MSQKKLWIAFGLVVGLSFAVLLYYGAQIYQQAPPVPERVVDENGNELFKGNDIRDGQNIWQSIGGQEIGTVWGHGAYVAPDWTADYLHREAQFLLNKWSREEYGSTFEELTEPEKMYLESRLQEFLRTNTYDEPTQTLVIHSERYEAFEHNKQHYTGIFMEDPELDELRAAYAIAKNTIRSQDRMDKMATFFFWASWACVTERPGTDITYTHNWPPDEQIGNVATSDLVLWTGFSIIMLLLGIGIMIFVQARTKEEETLRPVEDPLMNQTITPSMWAVKKILLGSKLADSCSSTSGCNHRTLRCGRRWFLRDRYSQIYPLLHHPDMAYSASYLLDSDLLVGNGPLHSSFVNGAGS